MKQRILIFTLSLVLGFIFEYLYYMTDSNALGGKIHFLGAILILIGTLGLWIFVILPYLGEKRNFGK